MASRFALQTEPRLTKRKDSETNIGIGRSSRRERWCSVTGAQEDFAQSVTQSCETREQWLSVMAFGLETLLAEPYLLMKLIVARAAKEATGGDRSVESIAACLLCALKLTVVKKAE